MGISYLLWALITLIMFLIYRNIGSSGSVDLQYFLNDTYPDELPTN